MSTVAQILKSKPVNQPVRTLPPQATVREAIELMASTASVRCWSPRAIASSASSPSATTPGRSRCAAAPRATPGWTR